MTGPFQTEIVVRHDGEEYEVRLSAADQSLPVAELAAVLWPDEVGRDLELDGSRVTATEPIAAIGLSRGAVVEPAAASGPVVGEFVGVRGRSAGEVLRVRPGVVRLGPGGGGSSDVGVQVHSAQGGAVSLYVDVDGTVTLDPGIALGSGADVWVNEARIGAVTRLQAGDCITVGASHYRYRKPLPQRSALAAGRSRSGGAIPFNRPPRAEFPTGLPLLVAPGAPPKAQQPMRFGWGALVVPVLMGAIMAVLWSPMMAIFAIFSPAMMLSNWLEDRRRARRSNSEAATALDDAMEQFRERFTALVRAAHSLARRSSPDPQAVAERIASGDTRMWQRRGDHPDFLELALGLADIRWEPAISPGEPDRAGVANQLIDSVPRLEQVPVVSQLAGGAVLGIAGHRRRQIEMARWLVLQAAYHHGPADLVLRVITDTPEEWEALKWLPHAHLGGDSTQVGIFTPGETADAMLAALLERDDDPAAALRSDKSAPTTLLLVDVADVSTSSTATLRQVLRGEGSLPRSGIALAPTIESLPSSCTEMIAVGADGYGRLHRPALAEEIDRITTWRLAGSAARRLSREIGRYRDPELSGTGADLADVVHLLDLLGIAERSPEAIVRRWDAAGPVPRCAAPIGATVDGPLTIDWVADGPHGLLAGTTGAGKSELLRSLVASLAASVDPEHLNFVLIDYKGGSAFDVCAALPHTVGMVTDLDGHLAHRALTCLEAELRYREERLRDVGASDIGEFHAMGLAEPLPRLLVVIDEFAALAKELPEFMASLVDIAQRGRSLGVHLLLATQRPNGVINDGIRANTNIRLSLRVQDVADSVDVVGTPQAATLPRNRPGRGFLRRGPGDVVAFQSALVTGNSKTAGAAVSVQPYTAFGEAVEPTPSGESGETDLEGLVRIIQQAAEVAGMRPTRSPWPEALPEAITRSELVKHVDGDGVPVPILGLADEPHRQRVAPYTWDPTTNLFIYGVVGSGTTTALLAAVEAACREKHPDRLHVYAMDFDDQRLVDLADLPHVGAVIGAGERERQMRLLRYLQNEIASRRESAGSGEAPPSIVVVVDNYAGFRAAFDDPADMAIKESLGRIVADGPGVGITVVATAKQPIDIPTTVAALVANKLVMRLADRYEYVGLGVSVDEPPGIPGRGFESGTSREVQIVLPSRRDLAAIGSDGPAPSGCDGAPWSIELLPTEVKTPDIVGDAKVFDLEWRVPIGLGDELLVPVGWTLREGDHVLITGPARSGKSTALATVATVLAASRPDVTVVALVARGGMLSECPAVDTLVRNPAELAEALESAVAGEPLAVLIDDADSFDDADGVIARLVADRDPHVHVFAAGAADILRSAYGHWTQAVRRSRQGLALKPNLSSDGDLWQVTLPRRGPTTYPPGRGFLVTDGTVELTQVAWQ